MQRVKHPPIRNKIDMTDRAQVRAWTRRLRLRANELAAIIEKVGNSAGAVTKEVELQRAPQQPVASSGSFDLDRCDRTKADAGVNALRRSLQS